MPSRRHFLQIAGAGALILPARPILAAEPPVFARRGRAIRGYDPVAYFRTGAPTEGDAGMTHTWQGVEWRFASAAHRDAFAADPAAFAPQFGGYCAWAVANGYTASTDPRAWDIVDGRLYLNHSLSVRDRWRQDVAGNIARGNANWPSVLSG